MLDPPPALSNYTTTCRSANRADAQIKGRTLSEPGELDRPPLPASVRLNVADLGGNGFGSFARKKRTSPAGAKPGNTEHHADTRTGDTRTIHTSDSAFLLANPKMNSRDT
jgi:hypothetical protein